MPAARSLYHTTDSTYRYSKKKMKRQIVHKDAFIVRIWREAGQSAWRGWVQHVHSGDSTPVQSLDELLAFIERRTGKLTDPGRKGLK